MKDYGYFHNNLTKYSLKSSGGVPGGVAKRILA